MNDAAVRTSSALDSDEPGASASGALAIVIPTLNEAARLPATIDSLSPQFKAGDQIVVADGGSIDGTATLAEARGCLVVVGTPLGRGFQIAAGIAASESAWIIVAHADMVFAAGTLDRFRRFVAVDPLLLGGCLGHRFGGNDPRLRAVELGDRFRAGFRGISFGDQCQFVRRDWLKATGGFPSQPIMEDLELAKRLRATGRWAYLNLPVTVSARRFEAKGFCRTIWENWRFRRLYARKGLAACDEIARRYADKPDGSPQVKPIEA